MNTMNSFDSIVTQVKLGGAVTSQLTVQMLQQMPLGRLYAEGFRNWDGTMVLLPLWAFNHMAPGEHLVFIDGEIPGPADPLNSTPPCARITAMPGMRRRR